MSPSSFRNNGDSNQPSAIHGRNAANRVEESYAGAKKLALRYPLAALGLVYALRSTAHTEKRKQFVWLVDLLIKLRREDDAYDACALIVPKSKGRGPDADVNETEQKELNEVLLNPDV